MTIACFLFLLLLIPLFTLALSTNDSELNKMDWSLCKKLGYKCGNQIFDICYPFWLEESLPYCAHDPGFELSCKPENKSLIINTGHKEYKVNYIDYTGQLFSVTTDRSFVDRDESELCDSIFTYSKCRGSNRTCYTEDEGSLACHCSDGTVRNDGSCAKDNDKGRFRAVIGAVAGVGGLFLVGTCIVLSLWVRKKRKLKANSSNLLSQSSILSSKMDPETGVTNYNTHIFTYDELEEATHGFHESRELGDGGFGTVYKGKLRDGRTVAVKRLYENNYRRLDQFLNEVEILSRLRHQNLVTLYGCTSRHSRELLLVYEYIPNGTLADHLHGPLSSKPTLPWPTRLSLIIQTAEALSYLHSVEPQIIHRDIKTTNILVDHDFRVKVADFGLSRLFPLNATHVSTAPQGTPGYVDPEYHLCFQLTDKSDVYSFGVVLVEIISSKPAVDISRHRHEISLANMAINKIQNCRMDELVDPDLGYGTDGEVRRMIDQVAELAFRCLQADGELRPGIKEVLGVLRCIKGEFEGEGIDSPGKEESKLLKNVALFSPDSVVTGRWSSQSTTPITSG